VCLGQSRSSTCSSHPAHSCAREKVHAWAHEHCGPSANISRRVLLPLYYGDRSTRWLEAVPIKFITAPKCVGTFIETWVARYRVPGTITSDRVASSPPPYEQDCTSCSGSTYQVHSLPPTEQRDGREGPWPAEGRPKGQSSCCRMARPHTLGNAGAEDGPQ
jgi:hypothetical protein